MKIYLGSDHAGFKMKQEIKYFLITNKYDFLDFTPNLREDDDYPDVAVAVSKSVAKHNGLGILVCGTGAGMCIAANKVRGIRAAQVYDSFTAKMSREHNDTNVICLRGRKMSAWKTKRILKIWLNTKFSGIDRHKRRIEKIAKFEK